MKEYEILFEDESVIVVNKTGPLPVQPEKTGDKSLQDLLAEDEKAKSGKSPDYLEAAHRIDRRASGIVIFAKSRKAAAALSEAFREGLVEKTYLAVVDEAPEPPEGRLEHDIAWDPRSSKARIADTSKPPERKDKDQRAVPLEYKKSSLSYKVAAKSERYVLLEIRLETGRPHQIRAQLAAIGQPVRGDLKYGARRSTKNGMIMLHAWRAEFHHPVTDKRMAFTASPPDTDNLWKAFDLAAVGGAAVGGTTPGGAVDGETASPS